MIDEVLAETVTAVEICGHDPSAYLFPEEVAQIRSAVEVRKREFAHGRTCARRALSKLGFVPAPILRGPNREPIWPSGIVGSITHCRGYCAAAVAMQKEIVSVGIDAEMHESLPPGVLEQISLEQEQAWLGTAPSGVHWDRLLFSAKESVYKAWYPVTNCWLGFDQVLVDFQPSQRTFRAHLISSEFADHTPPVLISGCFVVRDGYVLTAIVIPP